ncbi:TonB-dependent receptor [Aquifex pyrophilus]
MRKLILLTSLFSISWAQEVFLEEVRIEGKREVVTPERIRELPAKDVGEALEKSTPGVWKVRKGGIANDVVIRGFKREEVNQLFDGARVYNACPNRMDPGLFHVDFAEIKEIEVIKGPFDVKNYGAVGGTVNVRTQEPKKGVSGKLNLTFDNWNYTNASGIFSYGRDRLGFLIGYSFRFSKPYEDGKGRKITEIYPENSPFRYSPDEVNSTAFNIHTVWTKLSYKFRKDLKLKLDYAHQKANDVLYPYLMMDAILDEVDRFNAKLEGKRYEAQLYGSSVRHWMNNQKRVAGSTAPRGYSMETYAKTKVYGFKGSYKLKGITLGIDTFYRYWEATTTMYMANAGMYKSQNTIPDVDTLNFGLFLEHRRKLGKSLKLLYGLRLDYTRTKANKDEANLGLYEHYHGTRDTSKSDLYPSGNIQLFYEVSKELELFVGLGTAVRVPDPQERYFALDRMGSMEAKYGDWVGNPELDPERNTEIDLGLKLKRTFFNGEIRTFFSYVKDYIYPYKVNAQSTGNPMNQNTKAMSYTNIEAYFYGFEAKGTYAITYTFFIDGFVAYTRGKKKDTYPEKNIRDKDIAEIPPLTARIALRYDNGTFFGEVESLLASTQDNVDSDLNEKKTSGYGVINVKGGFRKKGITIYGGVENVFDKLYYTHLSYVRNPFSSGVKVPEPGRTYYITVSYTF